MGLIFRIQKGPNPGEILPISDGISFGRANATVKIADPKISGVHARIEAKGDALFLIDNASHNGVVVGKERLERVELKPGLVVQLGNTVLEVLEAPEVHERTKTLAPPPPPTPTPPVRAPLTWRERLAEILSKMATPANSLSTKLTPFPKPVRLEFIRGPQLDTKWSLSYGPREIGRYCAELPIFEPGAPGTCFQISMRGETFFFETSAPDKVQLNEKSVPSEEIHDGDIISISNTQIRIEL